jgi:flagellar hook-basal body complex protein FliE
MNINSSFPIRNVDLGLGQGAAVKPGGEASNFVDTLKQAIGQARAIQEDADNKVVQLAGGSQDVHSAMIAVEEANLSFQMMVQVRNKVLQAYQQVSGMQF